MPFSFDNELKTKPSPPFSVSGETLIQSRRLSFSPHPASDNMSNVPNPQASLRSGRDQKTRRTVRVLVEAGILTSPENLVTRNPLGTLRLVLCPLLLLIQRISHAPGGRLGMIHAECSKLDARDISVYGTAFAICQHTDEQEHFASNTLPASPRHESTDNYNTSKRVRNQRVFNKNIHLT